MWPRLRHALKPSTHAQDSSKVRHVLRRPADANIWGIIWPFNILRLQHIRSKKNSRRKIYLSNRKAQGIFFDIEMNLSHTSLISSGSRAPLLKITCLTQWQKLMMVDQYLFEWWPWWQWWSWKEITGRLPRVACKRISTLFSINLRPPGTRAGLVSQNATIPWKFQMNDELFKQRCLYVCRS